MLDEIRGFAIICMIFHHAFLDVGDVIGLEWGYEIFDALCTVQPIFWTIFIVISGMCSRLSRNTVKRGIIVLVCAGIITLATAVIMPLLGFVGAEIYFGILHCLGTCMVITGLLMPLFKKIDFRIGAAVSLILFLFVYGIEGGKICFGLISLPRRSSPRQCRGLSKISGSAPWFHLPFFGRFPPARWFFVYKNGRAVLRLAVIAPGQIFP